MFNIKPIAWLGYPFASKLDASIETCSQQLWSEFLSLPLEVRVHEILPRMTETDRKMLRIVSKQLLDEIDTFLGHADSLNLTDSLPKNSLHNFCSRTFFKSIIINESFTSISSPIQFKELIWLPESLESFTLSPSGVITSELAQTLLTKCTNLRSLKWSGIVIGKLFKSPHPTDLTYPRLTTLKIDASAAFLSKKSSPIGFFKMLKNIFKGLHPNLAARLTSQENLLSFMRNLHCPQIHSVTFGMTDAFNISEETHDQFEFHSEVIRFLTRHPECKEINILENLDSDLMVPALHCLKYYRSEINSIPLEMPTVTFPEIGQLKVTKFLLKSSWDFRYSRPSLTQWINLMQRFTQLKVLKVELQFQTPWLTWHNIETILTRNFKTLKEFQIAAAFSTSISFQIFNSDQAPTLKSLSIINLLPPNNLSPIILNYGPHQSITNNLESLTLVNLRPSQIGMDRFSRFKKLKSLALNDTLERSEGGSVILFAESFRQIVNIRTLESLNLQSTILIPDIDDDAVIHDIDPELIKFHKIYHSE